VAFLETGRPGRFQDQFCPVTPFLDRYRKHRRLPFPSTCPRWRRRVKLDCFRVVDDPPGWAGDSGAAAPIELNFVIHDSTESSRRDSQGLGRAGTRLEGARVAAVADVVYLLIHDPGNALGRQKIECGAVSEVDSHRFRVGSHENRCMFGKGVGYVSVFTSHAIPTFGFLGTELTRNALLVDWRARASASGWGTICGVTAH